MGGTRRGRTWRGWWASLGSLPMGGGSRVWVLAGDAEFRVGERERILDIVSVFFVGCGRVVGGVFCVVAVTCGPLSWCP